MKGGSSLGGGFDGDDDDDDDDGDDDGDDGADDGKTLFRIIDLIRSSFEKMSSFARRRR